MEEERFELTKVGIGEEYIVGWEAGTLVLAITDCDNRKMKLFGFAIVFQLPNFLPQ